MLVEIGADIFWGLGEMALKIFLIIIPLMIGLELLKGYGWLEKLTRPLIPLLHRFNLPSQAGVPFLVGQFLGLSYGAGVLIQYSREGELSPREMWLICLFLSLCHSLFEDTLLFVAVGANFWVLVGFRLILATGVTLIFSRFFFSGRPQNGWNFK